jgi:phosphopantothenoylcysteine decarboxylase
VVVAPCSADMLAKIAGGHCDNLAVSEIRVLIWAVGVDIVPNKLQLSLLRALPPSTPTVLCPAMNTQMYQHPYSAKHLKAVVDDLGYIISGPQGTGTLACGDEGRCLYPSVPCMLGHVRLVRGSRS